MRRTGGRMWIETRRTYVISIQFKVAPDTESGIVSMPFSIVNEVEIEEHGMCQQEPSEKVGDTWIDDLGRKRVVDDVRFVKYVWEDVALWRIYITVYEKGEY